MKYTSSRFSQYMQLLQRWLFSDSKQSTASSCWPNLSAGGVGRTTSSRDRIVSINTSQVSNSIGIMGCSWYPFSRLASLGGSIYEPWRCSVFHRASWLLNHGTRKGPTWAKRIHMRWISGYSDYDAICTVGINSQSILYLCVPMSNTGLTCVTGMQGQRHAMSRSLLHGP